MQYIQNHSLDISWQACVSHNSVNSKSVEQTGRKDLLFTETSVSVNGKSLLPVALS